jgi:hypothetical protein
MPRQGIEASKPYNPILGEIFKCYWDHGTDDKSVFLAEQISHHPPVTAFYMRSKKRGDFKYEGWVYPQTTISYYVKNVNIGPSIISFTPKGSDKREVYDLRQPPVAVNGLLYGAKYLEIFDQMKLCCQDTGYSAVINFLTGGTNKLQGSITKDGEELYTVEGVINKRVEVTDKRTKEIRVLYDVEEGLKRSPKYIAPLAEQECNESRRNWHKLTVALKKKDFSDAQLQKHLIEERERARRKKITEEYNKTQQKEQENPKTPVKSTGWMGSMWSYTSSVVSSVVGTNNTDTEEKHTGNYGHPGFTPKYFRIEGDIENNWKYTGEPIVFPDGTRF